MSKGKVLGVVLFGVKVLRGFRSVNSIIELFYFEIGVLCFWIFLLVSYSFVEVGDVIFRSFWVRRFLLVKDYFGDGYLCKFLVLVFVVGVGSRCN